MEDVRALPALEGKEAVWQCYVHRCRAWLPANDTVVRPWFILVCSVGDGAFLTAEQEEGVPGNLRATAAPPTPEELVEFLARVMRAPKVLNGGGKGQAKRSAGRPTAVAFADTATARAGSPGDKAARLAAAAACPYVAGCKDALASVGCQASYAPVPGPLLREIVRDQVEAGLRGTPDPDAGWSTAQLAGLGDSVPGFVDAFGKSLFAAAAGMLAADPWRDGCALLGATGAPRRVIHATYAVPLDAERRMRVNAFGLVVGDGPLADGNFGLALYKTEDAARRAALQVDSGSTEASAAQSLLYVAAPDMPFEDLDDAERCGWPTRPAPSVDACVWPLFIKVSRDPDDAVSVERPAIVELQCFEVVASALARLLDEGHLDCAGSEGPWELTITSKAAKGEAEEIAVKLSLLPQPGPAGCEGDAPIAGDSPVYI